jgi:hypothetical protein
MIKSKLQLSILTSNISHIFWRWYFSLNAKLSWLCSAKFKADFLALLLDDVARAANDFVILIFGYNAFVFRLPAQIAFVRCSSRWAIKKSICCDDKTTFSAKDWTESSIISASAGSSKAYISLIKEIFADNLNRTKLCGLKTAWALSKRTFVYINCCWYSTCPKPSPA